MRSNNYIAAREANYLAKSTCSIHIQGSDVHVFCYIKYAFYYFLCLASGSSCSFMLLFQTLPSLSKFEFGSIM